jgi:hypothetical protein
MPRRTRFQKSSEPIRKLVYCFSSHVIPFHVEENMGLEEIPSLLEQARQRGLIVEEIDLLTRSEEDQWNLYSRAIQAVTISKCAIRQVFGSHGHGGGPYFGREVPALLVYRGELNLPVEVYPCRYRREGRTVTIQGFLKSLLGSSM